MKEMSFCWVFWMLSGILYSVWGWADHSTSMVLWMRMFWRVILRLSVMVLQAVWICTLLFYLHNVWFYVKWIFFCV